MFAKKKHSKEVRDLLRRTAVPRTPPTSGTEDDVRDVDQILNDDEAMFDNENRAAEGSVVDVENDHEEPIDTLRNPCPGLTNGHVAVLNFDAPDLVHRADIEKYVGTQLVRELEQHISLAWEFEVNEIKKDSSGIVDDILSTLPLRYREIQLEEISRLLKKVGRGLEGQQGVSGTVAARELE